MFKLEENEKIIKVLRRHYFVMLPIILTIFVFAILPFFTYSVITSEVFAKSFPFTADYDFSSLFKDFISKWGVFSYSIWILILWIFLFIEWTDYYLDLWVITNKRILDVEQRGFFRREVTSFGYDYIQDITIETKGFIQTMLKFGTLHIQTAGHNKEILIRDASNPENARALILDLQHRSK